MHSLCISNQYIAIKQNFQGIFVCLDKPFTQEIRIFLNFVHDDMQAKYTAWFFAEHAFCQIYLFYMNINVSVLSVVCHSDPYIHKEKHYPTSNTTFLACVRGKL